MPQHRNGLQLDAHAKLVRSWTDLYFNVEQKLWAVAFVLALLATRLHLFHGEVDGDGTLGSQDGSPLNFTQSINHTTEPHPPVWVSGNSFPRDTARTNFPLITHGPRAGEMDPSRIALS